jgi:tetratricopeptide (TPR) repeat protein
LEEAAREREDWQTVARLVHTRAKHTTDAKEQLSLLCELGSIFSEKLDQPDSGLPFLEQALEIAPDDPDVLEPLANLYFAAGRDEDAERLYKGLVEQLSKGRRSKKLGRLEYRLGALAERRGDREEALSHYDQAYRIDTTFAPTLVALGKLHMAEEAWDKARRIYRSMLLQNIDQKETGITKADIYHSLGYIHLKSGEDRKARNMLQRGLELDPEHAEIKALLDEIQP